MARTIVISDVHGCFQELMKLLEKVKYSNSDRLIFVGDLVDRGPDSGSVVKWVREMHHKTGGLVSSVAGNHDDKYVKWANHQTKRKENPKHPIAMRFDENNEKVFAELNEEDIAFMRLLPSSIFIEQSNWVIVHAGLVPNVSLANQKRGTLTHIRYVDNNSHKPVSLDENLNPPANSVYWTDVFAQNYNVAYGHNVHNLMFPNVKHNKSYLVGIDTGCCFGGRLTAFVLPQQTNEPITQDNFVQIQSQKIHYKSKKIDSHS